VSKVLTYPSTNLVDVVLNDVPVPKTSFPLVVKPVRDVVTAEEDPKLKLPVFKNNIELSFICNLPLFCTCAKEVNENNKTAKTNKRFCKFTVIFLFEVFVFKVYFI
ncbi:MAG TPA: hypothetical protein DDZ41_08510, partial [Flavobacterium sp.]|nr:hypothetical protein [Flavobacterium sp.]